MEAISLSTMDSIFAKQNEPQLLKCIAAQRNEYDKAKRRGLCKDILTAIFAILSIISSWIDNDVMTAITFLFAGMTSFASKYIDMHVHKHKNVAAVTQQYVDVTLYNSVLNDKIGSWGNIPTYHELAETISIVADKDVEGVKNWYSDYSSLKPIEQIFCCQKENLRWDIKLRQEFKYFLLVVNGLVFLLLIIAAFVINPSLIKTLCIISWLLPLIDFLYSYWDDLRKDIERLQKLKAKSAEIDNTISRKDFCTLRFDSQKVQQVRTALIELQKDIFEHREKSTLIPNWFYKIRQKAHQASEDKIANEVKMMSMGSDKNET